MGLLLHGAKKNFYKYLGELIERTASTVHLSEKVQCRKALMNSSAHMDQLRNLLTKTCSARSLLLVCSCTRPKQMNCKQPSLFQYCMGAWGEWKDSCGVFFRDGKSRILTFTCLAGLKTGMLKKVYLVFGNKHLMECDRADFKDLWRLAGCVN